MLVLDKSQEMPGANRCLEQATVAGTWLTSVLGILNDTNMSADKFWDNLHLRFELDLMGIRNECNGYGARLAVDHDLQCRKNGLILVHHNYVAD